MSPIRRSVLAACVLAGGCSYYDSSLLAPAGGAGSGPADASIPDDVATADNGSEQNTCSHARPPDPPVVTGAGGAIEFVVAISEIDFGEAKVDGGYGYDTLGYDLDSRCTCQGETNGCLRPPWASAEACDGLEGRDSQGGQLIRDLSQFAPAGTTRWNTELRNGNWTLLIRIQHYNGLDDDDQVDLALYVPTPFDAELAADGGGALPAWDGTDAWPIRDLCLGTDAGGEPSVDFPKYVDTHAYVSQGVLVASGTSAPMRINEFFTVELTAPFFTARVEKDAQSRWILTEGTLAGRWKLQDILAQVGQFKDPVFDQPICVGSVAYSNLKAKACSYADILSYVAAPSVPCDSLSLGVAFETVAARLGNPIQVPVDERLCAPEVDPANDTCETL